LVAGNTAVGFVLGSVVADIAVYVMTVVSDERFTTCWRVIALRQTHHLNSSTAGGIDTQP